MLILLLTWLATQMPAGMTHEQHHKDADLKTRGAATMGFDQDATIHHFRLAADGGSIEVSVKDAADDANTTAIRSHLREIATAFASGDFSKPLLTHAEHPPGSAQLAALRSSITYDYEETPNGGRVRIRSTNPDAVQAVHDFLRYQIAEHHTGDPTTPPK